jgi:hypothetical protein
MMKTMPPVRQEGFVSKISNAAQLIDEDKATGFRYVRTLNRKVRVNGKCLGGRSVFSRAAACRTELKQANSVQQSKLPDAPRRSPEQ